VLDTGIDTAHPEFEGRARSAFDAVDAPARAARSAAAAGAGGSGAVGSDAAGSGTAGGTAVEGDSAVGSAEGGDCDGHGTVVAGIAASRRHGVAPEAQVRSVKVLDCHGAGTLTSLLAGIDWVARNAQRPAVAVMSWSYGPSDTLAAAVRGLVDGGVFVATSAGNSGSDDCAALPRAVPGVLVVASAARDDRRAATSSTGPCVDVYAPGVGIVSTTPGGGTDAWSGTSMAAPHAAGVAALYKQAHGDAPSAEVERWIVDHATTGVVAGGGTGGTPNRLLYAGGL
jgi:subtilisin family serine protease